MSQPAFALVSVEWFHAACRDIRKTAVQRGQCHRVEWRTIPISRVTEIFQQHACQFCLIVGEVVDKLMKCLSGGHGRTPF